MSWQSWQFWMFLAAFCSIAYFLREMVRAWPDFRRDLRELERQRRYRQVEREVAEYKKSLSPQKAKDPAP